jgi:hypothetical protein
MSVKGPDELVLFVVTATVFGVVTHGHRYQDNTGALIFQINRTNSEAEVRLELLERGRIGRVISGTQGAGEGWGWSNFGVGNG